MPSEFIRIPHERIGVLIGPKGVTKRTIEKKSQAKIDIDSDSGEVVIDGEDAVKEHKTVMVIQAIGRGFNPEKALLLLDDEYYLSVLKLKEMFGKSKKSLTHKKGRVIGKEGKVREKIEEDTNCFISIYGNTVSIIGKETGLEKAENAVKLLLGGMDFNIVENVLEEKKLVEKKFEL